MDNANKFTVEDSSPDEVMHCLDTITTPDPDGTLITGQKRKPLTQISTYSKTVTITLLQNTLSSIHLHALCVCLGINLWQLV